MIDLADKKLIMALFNDGRATISSIAKRIRVSREKCLYRLNKLKEEGIIKKIIPVINFSLTGVSLYRVQLKLMHSAKHEELINELKQLKKIAWLVKLHGNWDIVFSVWARDIEEFEETYKRILEKYGGIIEDKLFTVVTNIEHYPPTYILSSQRKVYETHRNQEKTVELENNQLHILNYLLEDGRMPLYDIANKMNCSISTVKYHMKKLKEGKILLGFRPVLDVNKLGYQHFKVMLELLNYSEKQKCHELLKNCNNVVYITESIGKYDLEFEAEFASLKELLEFIEKIKNSVGVKNYELIFTNEELIVQEVLNE